MIVGEEQWTAQQIRNIQQDCRSLGSSSL